MNVHVPLFTNMYPQITVFTAQRKRERERVEEERLERKGWRGSIVEGMKRGEGNKIVHPRIIIVQVWISRFSFERKIGFFLTIIRDFYQFNF